MSSDNKSPSTGEKTPWYLYILAGIAVAIVQPYKWLKEQVYRGWEGAFRAVIGFLIGVGAAVTSGHYLGWTLGWNTFGWVTSAVAIGFVVYAYLWPLLYLFPIRPTWRLADAIYDRTRAFLKKHFEGIAKGIVNVISTICLGSGLAWTKVMSKEHEESWFGRLVAILSGMTTIGGAIYLGWKTYLVTGAALAAFGGIISFIAAVTAGVFVLGVVGGLVWNLLEHGKFPFIGLATGGAAVYAAASSLTALGASFGLTGTGGAVASLAIGYLLFVGYAFPLINLMFSTGFWSWVWKKIKPLSEKTYDDKDEKYSELFHHVVNLLVTAGLGYGAWVACGSLAFGLAVSVTVTALVAAVSYIGFYKVVAHDGGNFFTGALTSLGVGILAGKYYVAAGLLFGIYGAIAVAALVILFTGFIGFPLVYLGVRLLGKPISGTGLGTLLNTIYSALNEQFKSLMKQLKNAYRSCYDDKSGYKEGFLHVANVGTAVGAFFAASALTGLAGSGATSSLIVAISAAVLSYVFIGKLTFKVGWGLEFVGAVIALLAGGWAGTSLYASNPTDGMKIAGIAVAIVAWCATYALLFPVAYVIVRPLTNWAVGGFLKTILAGIHGAAWSVVEVGWNAFVVAFKAVKTFFTPAWIRFATAMGKLKKAFNEIMDKVAGRGK